MNPEEQLTAFDVNVWLAKHFGWRYEFNGDYEDPQWFWVPPNDPDGTGEPPDYIEILGKFLNSND